MEILSTELSPIDSKTFTDLRPFLLLLGMYKYASTYSRLVNSASTLFMHMNTLLQKLFGHLYNISGFTMEIYIFCISSQLVGLTEFI